MPLSGAESLLSAEPSRTPRVAKASGVRLRRHWQMAISTLASSALSKHGMCQAAALRVCRDIVKVHSGGCATLGRFTGHPRAQCILKWIGLRASKRQLGGDDEHV